MLRFIGAIVLLAAVVMGIGHFSGWFSFSTSTTHAGDTKIELDVHGDEFKADAKKLKNKVGALIERIKGDALVAGSVQSVDAGSRGVELETEDGEVVSITLSSSAAILIDGEVSDLGQVRPGDNAVIQLEKEGEMGSAHKLVVVRER